MEVSGIDERDTRSSSGSSPGGSGRTEDMAAGGDQGAAAEIGRSGPSENRRSRRGAEADVWFNLALSHLIRRYEPALAWLLDDPRSIASGGGQIKKRAIISELGKLRDGDSIIMAAREICSMKPGVRRAISMIRRYRLGRPLKPSEVDLAEAILVAVDRYLKRHPETTQAEIVAALEEATACWAEHEGPDA
jgi:hypothetical protein